MEEKFAELAPGIPWMPRRNASQRQPRRLRTMWSLGSRGRRLWREMTKSTVRVFRSTRKSSIYVTKRRTVERALKNGPTPASFSFIFGLFKQTSLQFLQQIYVKKCPSSMQCQDSNPRPSDCESLPITTRPGLPPMSWRSINFVFCSLLKLLIDSIVVNIGLVA